MSEVTIRTSFGEIRYTYNSEEELNLALQGFESQVKSVETAIKNIAAASPRLPKEGFERLYRFTSSGKLELFRIPRKGTESVALALFAYFPHSVTAEEIEKVTGLQDVGRKVLWQPRNKQYFRKSNDGYSLHPEGIRLAEETAKSLLAGQADTEDVQK